MRIYIRREIMRSWWNIRGHVFQWRIGFTFRMRVAQKNKLSRNSENQWARRCCFFREAASTSAALSRQPAAESSGGGVTFFVLLKRVDLPLQMTAECFVVRCVASRRSALSASERADGKKRARERKKLFFRTHTLSSAAPLVRRGFVLAGRRRAARTGWRSRGRIASFPMAIMPTREDNGAVASCREQHSAAKTIASQHPLVLTLLAAAAALPYVRAARGTYIYIYMYTPAAAFDTYMYATHIHAHTHTVHSSSASRRATIAAAEFYARRRRWVLLMRKRGDRGSFQNLYYMWVRARHVDMWACSQCY